MLSKMDIRVQMDAKSAQLRNECKIEHFSAPADPQDSAKRTTINAFEVSLMVQFRVHLIIRPELYLKVHFKIYIKMCKKVAPKNALKGALLVALELYLFMRLLMHKSTPNASIKGEIAEVRYAALESVS